MGLSPGQGSGGHFPVVRGELPVAKKTTIFLAFGEFGFTVSCKTVARIRDHGDTAAAVPRMCQYSRDQPARPVSPFVERRHGSWWFRLGTML